MTIRFFIKCTIILTSLCLIFTATPASALANANVRTTIPELTAFVKLVENGQANVLRGVYVKDLISLRVVQQPVGNNTFVSPMRGYLTQFRDAIKYGNTGLLAHNYLEGQTFFQLAPKQKIQLIYGDGKIKTFIITDIQQYRALSPDNPTSDFINLETKSRYTASQLFTNTYGNGTGKLVLQTCIFANQNPSWGRLFIIAEPIE